MPIVPRCSNSGEDPEDDDEEDESGGSDSEEEEKKKRKKKKDKNKKHKKKKKVTLLTVGWRGWIVWKDGLLFIAAKLYNIHGLLGTCHSQPRLHLKMIWAVMQLQWTWTRTRLIGSSLPTIG